METLILETRKKYNIEVLSLSPKGEFQTYLEANKISIHYYQQNTSNSVFKIILNSFFLIHFCYKHNIDVVWSHLHPCNFYAVLAQFFIRAKVVIFRHHFHAEIKKNGFINLNKNELFFEKWISILAKKIIVPSLEVYNGMVHYEKVDKCKIEIIPYIYDFKQYSKPNRDIVNKIRNDYRSDFLILIASRMIPLKRHFLVLPILKSLIEEGLNIKVILLDDGELKVQIQKYILDNKLENNIFLLGFKSNVVDYISSSDLILHPSYTEASSSLIKEAGLMYKPVIVCDGVGDFSDYIINNFNGFLIQENNEETEIKQAILKLYYDKELRSKLSDNLHHTVLDKFSPTDKVLDLYFKNT